MALIAIVVRADDTGIWVAPLGEDRRQPYGPCRGADHAAVGDIVLLTETQERPWISSDRTPPAGVSLVPNGGFEATVVGTGGNSALSPQASREYPSYWSFFWASSTANPSYRSASLAPGSKALEVRAGPEQDQKVQSGVLPVLPGAIITISGQAKRSTAGTLWVALHTAPAGEDPQHFSPNASHQFVPVALSTTLAPFAAACAVPARHQRARVEFGGAALAGEGTVSTWLDNIYVSMHQEV